MQQTLYAANRGLGAKLAASEPTGPLGCDHRRARPVGAVRARSDLLWANLTGVGGRAEVGPELLENHLTLLLIVIWKIDNIVDVSQLVSNRPCALV